MCIISGNLLGCSLTAESHWGFQTDISFNCKKQSIRRLSRPLFLYKNSHTFLEFTFQCQQVSPMPISILSKTKINTNKQKKEWLPGIQNLGKLVVQHKDLNFCFLLEKNSKHFNEEGSSWCIIVKFDKRVSCGVSRPENAKFAWAGKSKHLSGLSIPKFYKLTK